jgi:hypothetical protein
LSRRRRKVVSPGCIRAVPDPRQVPALVHVILSPVVIGDSIYRIVAPLPSLLEVEEWMGEWWEPSTLTFRMVASAPPASQALLAERGVPRDEWGSPAQRATAEAIDAMLLAHVIFRPPTNGAPLVDGPGGRRRKSYPGSARFGKRVRSHGRRADDAPGAAPVIPLGPRRRRSDQKQTPPTGERKQPPPRVSD